MQPRTSYLNPYVIGQPVSDPKMFFGRQHVFAWLRAQLDSDAQPRLLLLHGPGGIGKSSFLRQLGPDSLGNGRVAACLDLQAISALNMSAFLWSLTKAITDGLNEAGMRAPRLEKRMLVLHSEMTFIEALWQPAMEALGNQQLVIALDSADRLLSAAPESDEAAILSFLHDLPGGDRRVFFLLALGSRLEILDASTLAPFVSARSLRLKGLTRDETLALMRQPVPYWVPARIADYVHALTKGHPGDIQRICHTLFERARPRRIRQLTLADVLAVLADKIEAHQLHTPVYRRRVSQSVSLGSGEEAGAS